METETETKTWKSAGTETETK